jgi:hypothetical protein
MSTSRKDKVTLNEQIELFNGGFKVGGWQNRPMFLWMYQEFDFLMYMPKDWRFSLDGNRDYLGKSSIWPI